MKKFVNNTNINQIILPLTSDEAESLEDFLTESVALPRGKEEFVVVLGEDDMSEAIDSGPIRGLSLISYGRYNKACFSEKEKNEIQELLVGFGRQWLRNNDFEIFESIH